MFTTIKSTMKKFFVDTFGEDLAEVSSGLSKGAKTAIVLGASAATEAGTNALSNSSNNASDTAASKVHAPICAQATPTPTSQAVYKLCDRARARDRRVLGRFEVRSFVPFAKKHR